MSEETKKKIHKVGYVVILLGIVGLIDSLYLVSKQIADVEIGTCPVFGTGCGDVLSSKYSNFLGIPLSYYGLLFYGTMTALGSLLAFKFSRTIETLVSLGAIVGFVLSVSFIYIQGVLIGAYCFYCVISAVTSTLIFFTMLPTIIGRVLEWKDTQSEN